MAITTLIHIPRTLRKYRTGTVVSDKMNKTIVVLIKRRALHPVYKKYVVVSKKIKAHDEENAATVGDTVRVIESRHLSKDKCWRLVNIINRGESQ